MVKINCPCQKVLYRTVSLNSKHRSGGTNTHCTFKFRGRDGMKQITRFRIKNVQVPFSFYYINETNNKMYISSTTTANMLITVPPGNYDATDLIDVIIAQLNVLDAPIVWTGVYSAVTMKYTISISANTFIMNAIPSATGLGLFEIIGGTSESVSENSTLLVYTSTAVVNLTPRYIMLHSNILSPSNWYSDKPGLNGITGVDDNKDRTHVSKGNSLLKIPVNVSSNNIILFEQKLEERYPIQINILKKIDFYLTDQNGIELDLNNLNWSLTIEFWVNNPTLY